MADIANKYAENVSGKFYCDDQCIDCDLCRETAPANFTRSDDGGYSYVIKQPTTPGGGGALQGSHGRMSSRSHRQQWRRLTVKCSANVLVSARKLLTLQAFFVKSAAFSYNVWFASLVG